jgi:amidohydrolase
MKDQAKSASERLRPDILDLSKRIYENPELSNEEKRASNWCAEILGDHNFEIEWVDGVETAFVATRHGNQPGPTIGFLAEYDALPGVGHGCGHNLIAGSAVGAGLALADSMPELPGTIKVFGCPAEEIGQGKPAMLKAGAFAGTDAALTFHAYHTTTIMTQCNGIKSYQVTFHGKPSHAATDPWIGASALDGVLLTYQNLNALRQFIRDGVRIHGIVTDGGAAHNIIPEKASCHIAVRAVEQEELERVVGRAMDCIDAAALASGTTVETELAHDLFPVKYNAQLAQLHTHNLEALGEQVSEWPALASTDFGNVSQEIPAILFSVETWPKSTAFHTHEAAQAAGQEKAYNAMMTAATSMALTAIDLLTDPEQLQQIGSVHNNN